MSTATVTTNGETVTESYLYDWAGTRTAKITDGVLTYYLVDTGGVLSQVLAELDSTGALITYYTRGAEIISLSRPGEKHYYLHDGHGSVRALSDADGQVTDTYLYDAFGNLLTKTGTTANDFLYTGEQFDANTGFYYLRARYMNPSMGTFTSPDAYAGTIFDPVSLHKYLYANANPVMNRDPSGYVTYGELLGAMAINAVLGAAIGGLSGLILNVLYYDTHGGDMQSPDRNKVAWEGFWKGALFGAAGGALFGGLGLLGTEFIFANILIGVILIFMGMYSLGKSFEFYMNGDTLWGDIYLLIAGLSFIGSGFSFGKAWSMAFDDFYVPASVGAAGNVEYDLPTGGKITGYTKHGAEQALGRDGGIGVSNMAIMDAVNNPVKAPVIQSGGTTKYIGHDATVVLNQEGKVVTTWANSSVGTRR